MVRSTAAHVSRTRATRYDGSGMSCIGGVEDTWGGRVEACKPARHLRDCAMPCECLQTLLSSSVCFNPKGFSWLLDSGTILRVLRAFCSSVCRNKPLSVQPAFGAYEGIPHLERRFNRQAWSASQYVCSLVNIPCNIPSSVKACGTLHLSACQPLSLSRRTVAHVTVTVQSFEPLLFPRSCKPHLHDSSCILPMKTCN
jgi:hypothetical protein